MLALVLMLGCVVSASAATTINPDTLSYPVRTPASTANNPVIEGESPFTGLKAETAGEQNALENYTPILVVYDNNIDGFMHTGIGAADIVFQVPNQSTGNNKQLALFSTHFPENAGGTRSARMTAFPFALALDAAFVSAGTPPIDDITVGVDFWRHEWNYSLDNKFFDTTSGRNYKHREGSGDTGLMAHLQEIRNNYLIPRKIEFEKRPFLFADEPLTRGEIANVIDMKFYASSTDTSTNQNSDCTFHYEEGMGYTREMAKGIEYDKKTMEYLYFANVIVMRVQISSKAVMGTGYLFYKDQLTGSGKADIFQNGRYIRGSWYRDKKNSRLIFLDDEGNELKFQRGKSYIVVNNSNCVVTYDE